MNIIKYKKSDIIVIGLALFAMFFGAGNLIFPPFLGMTSGVDWFDGFLSFIIADIGLAFVAMVAMMNGDGKMSGVTGEIGKIPSLILNTAVIVCIGPLLAIPRTAATTYEMSILPHTDAINPLVFSIIFFVIIFILAIRPSKIVDIVGKFLTPLMFLSLLILIVAGITNPIGEIVAPTSENIVKDGIIAGYQAMDMLASLGFAIIIISAVNQKGYTSKNDRVKVTVLSCVVAGVILFIVYGGLTYLGATASPFAEAGLNQAGLLVAITNGLMGSFGVAMLGVIVGLACLTTAIGLTSAAGSYFEIISNGKIKYQATVLITTIFGIVVGNFGLSTIINIANPILTVIYPIVLVLIVLSLFKNKITNKNIHKAAALLTFIVSILSVADSYTHNIEVVRFLPFFEYGFNWVIPAIVGGFFGAMLKEKK